MHWLSPSEALIFAFNTAAAAFLAIQLVRLGLHRTYRFLTAWLVWTSLIPACVVCIGFFKPTWYYVFYFVAEGPSVALMLLVVLEVFTFVLRGLPGIARLTNLYIRVAVILCVLGAAALLLLEKRPRSMWTAFHLFKQTVYCSALGFVLLLVAFLRWYPVKVDHNTLVYATGFSVYFSCETAFLLLLNTSHNQVRVVSPVLNVVSSACLVYWGLRLRPEAEGVPAAHAPPGDDEVAVMRRLRGLSDHLSKRSRY